MIIRYRNLKLINAFYHSALRLSLLMLVKMRSFLYPAIVGYLPALRVALNRGGGNLQYSRVVFYCWLPWMVEGHILLLDFKSLLNLLDP